jgi:hypothetical protein
VCDRGGIMKRIITVFGLLLMLIPGYLLQAKPRKNIPGLATMQKHGTKLDPDGILDRIGEAMYSLPGGGIAYAAFQEAMAAPNDEPVFVISSIEYDRNGLATDIQGSVQVPSTVRSFVALGGLGSPVYEAAEPNEFGVIFGRKGNLAVRDGVVVKVNTLDEAEIYELFLQSETYDKITRASILYQGYAAIRTPYLQNMTLELEGLLLNAASKDAILKGIKDFKKKNRRMSDEEVMINFLKANKSYLAEIKESNREARARIRESRKLLDACSSACALQTVELVEHFAEMAATIAAVTLSLDPIAIASATARYISENVPKNMDITFQDLQQIQNYSKYQMNQYQKNQKKNQKLWKNAMEIQREIQ